MNNEKILKALNDGKIAAIAADHFGSLILDMKQRRLSQLTQSVRMGQIDQATLLSGLAAIVALDDLKIEIEKRIERGHIASNELHKEQK